MISDFKSYNRNVKLGMISSIFVMSSNGLIMSTIFSIFIEDIGGTEVIIGLVSLFGGFILLLVLLPAGIFADKFKRKYALRIGILFSLTGSLLFYLSNTILNVFISYGIYNFGNGFINPSREALIADSVVTNQREKIYGQYFFLQMASNGLGPLVAVIMFFFIGNNWSLVTLKQVIFVGIILLIIGLSILGLMDDKNSLGSESESVYYYASSLKDDRKSLNILKKTHVFIQGNSIALFVVFLGLIIGIGAGMTVQFFPLFFKNIYKLSPMTTNLIYFLVAVLTGVMGIVTSKSVKFIGKIESIIIVQIIAIINLLIIATLPPLIIVIPVFILRGSFMNASQPVKNALIMDLVPKKNRGIFQSLQVLSQNFFWSLSAGIGGFLLQFYNFPILYVTTATIYIFGTLPYFLIRKKISINYNEIGRLKTAIN